MQSKLFRGIQSPCKLYYLGDDLSVCFFPEITRAEPVFAFLCPKELPAVECIREQELGEITDSFDHILRDSHGIGVCLFRVINCQTKSVWLVLVSFYEVCVRHPPARAKAWRTFVGERNSWVEFRIQRIGIKFASIQDPKGHHDLWTEIIVRCKCDLPAAKWECFAIRICYSFSLCFYGNSPEIPNFFRDSIWTRGHSL